MTKKTKKMLRFGLDFRAMPKETLAGPSCAWLYLKKRDPGPMKGDFPLQPERIYLTPYCDSIIEFEYQINCLKKDIDAILKEAKRKFDKVEESR
ncbi:MAG: hypothetical protein ABSF79_08625 [Smithellaceae bacterium]|jgi:hypothetical protein